MKKSFILALMCCFAALFVSCQTDMQVDNPVAGTSWEWSEDPITWTFTFSEKEVTFDYRAEFGPIDITTSQYKAPYTYTSNTVSFDITVWSNIAFKFTGTIDGDEMVLVDTGTEQMNLTLKKK